MTTAPTIYWIRRDFRLEDNPALVAAAAEGAVLPVVILDAAVTGMGAAPRWRYEEGLKVLAQSYRAHGVDLVIRAGDALEVLRALVAETGARSVHWNRLYDPKARARDAAIKTALRDQGIAAQSHNGHLLFEPWEVETGQGGFYRVYTPYWRAVMGRDVARPLPLPPLRAVSTPPKGISAAALNLAPDLRHGARVLSRYTKVGAAAAQAKLHDFLAHKAGDYKDKRDFLDLDACSNLSEHLSLGEISPRQIWAMGWEAHRQGAAGAEHFVKELVWREFAYHLLYHTPHIATENWRPEWDSFPWATDPDAPQVRAWKQGRTGVEVIDAAMRELYVTGRMHNRARMLVGSYLTKHMLCHWKIGLDWFADCLIDWDPAANAMGWQWVAGSGPDAAPYFRVFNPETQGEKFDQHGRYRRKWVAELSRPAPQTALDFFEAAPRTWGLRPDMGYPNRPIVDLAEGRARALAAYGERNS
ncbi:DNA photolyase family protein [Rhodobacteraceae bacterium XHP0102]|nr:DNA photolyase family protein [Rhodobacteraceae bacterium XHP0102]